MRLAGCVGFAQTVCAFLGKPPQQIRQAPIQPLIRAAQTPNPFRAPTHLLLLNSQGAAWPSEDALPVR